MVKEHRMADYKSCLSMASELAKVHGCIYYVYDTGEHYQVTPTLDADRKVMGRAYPGGRITAEALVANRPN